MPTTGSAAESPRLRFLVLLLPLLFSACAGLDRDDRGQLQPQTVRGPCQVEKFYVLGLTAVHTTMTVGNAGTACSFTVFNPALQVVLTQALVTEPPAHGRATAALVTLGRQAEIAYTPEPGYVGADRFTVTLEPHDLAIAVAVTVQPRPPAS